MYSPLVSIIVPVYNVEEYLNESIKSAINQSYKNIEIILIDDGSTDSCGSICNSYAMKDDRISVFHQKNMGLSAARNMGVSLAKGELISFLDSDDYMSPFMIEKMVTMMKKYNADVCCCDYTSTAFSNKTGCIVDEYDNQLACASLLDSKGFKCYAWNKIYKKQLFDNIKYPVGRYFEDISTTYRLFSQANKIVYLHEELYYYRLRRNSITRETFSDKNYDLIFAINEILELSASLYASYRNRLAMGYMQYYLTFLKSALISQVKLNEENSKLRKFIFTHLKSFTQNFNVTFVTKVELLLFLISPKLFEIIYKSKQALSVRVGI